MDIYRTISNCVQNHPTAWNVLHPPYILAQDRLKKWRSHHQNKGRLIRSAAEGNDRIKRAILLGEPCLIGKIGSTESQGLDCYLRREGSPIRYPPILRDQLFTLCGVFPPTDAFLDQFCSVYLNAVDAVDLLAVWGNSGESNVVARHAGKAVLIQRLSLEPYHFDDPWSSALAGKTVLVVHPFVAAPFRRGTDRRGRDIVVAAFVKLRGRIGIHTGGPTRILFGILGRRWEETRENRVLQSQFKRVEQGGYW